MVPLAAISVRNLDDHAKERLRIRAARHGRSMEIDGFDAQIASICRTHDAVLATRNRKDFHDTGIDVIDPWPAV